jgi:HK97 family phage major capsid protein
LPEVYDSLIDRSDAGATIPEDVSRQIIQSLPEESVALGSFRRVTMSRGQQRLPVLSVLPVAYWVDGDTGLKQTSEVNWDNKYLDARELAVIIPIPEAVLDDSDYDLWAEIKPRLVEAFGAKIDAAALFGLDKPSGWPDDIVTAAIAAGNTYTEGDSTVDLAEDINQTMALVEDDGFDVSGFWAKRRLRSALRGLRDGNNNPIFIPSLVGGTPGTLYGEPIRYVSNGAWDSSLATLIAGDTNAAILGVRQDITYKMLTESVISDADGKVILNLAQQDSVALRCVMRVAFQVANPITLTNPTLDSGYPFAVLQPAAS